MSSSPTAIRPYYSVYYYGVLLTNAIEPISKILQLVLLIVHTSEYNTIHQRQMGSFIKMTIFLKGFLEYNDRLLA